MKHNINNSASAAPRAIDEGRWRAVLARDRRRDDEFVYSVSTTGIYCRPSCPARRPNPGNVRFYASAVEAEQQGFRPCKRCRPDANSLADEHARMVAHACRRIETAETAPSLAELAAEGGLSPFHFHRIFKSITGLTPKGYAVAHRQKRMRRELARSTSVTEAIYNAGFNSSGRFYAETMRALGMRPASFRSGGKGSTLRYAFTKSTLGTVLVAATEKGIAAVALADAQEPLLESLRKWFPKAELIAGGAEFRRIVARVVAAVENPAGGFSLPLDVQGTIFQHRVWRALCDIPAGTTATYAQIAKRIGMPHAARAVAGACAANRIAVAIPCHRVIRMDGDLSGYRWGVKRKEALLRREQGKDDTGGREAKQRRSRPAHRR